ncbi:MAG: hypothetical protein WB565_17675 [Acidimicrobiales bacterium]
MSIETARTTTEGTLGVVHVPKSGGIAVRTVLRELDGSHATAPYFDRELVASVDVGVLPPSTRDDFVEDGQLREICDEHRLVMGHYSGQLLVDSGCRTLALQVREPRSRVLSLYRYWQSRPDEVIDQWGEWGRTALVSARGSLSEFLRSPHIWPAADSAIARQLLLRRTPPDARAARRLTRKALHGEGYESMRAHLEIVEWASESQRFVERICAFLDEKTDVTVHRENETPMEGEVELLDRKSREVLERLTRYDRELEQRLMDDGLLELRSAAALDAEFEETAERLGVTSG